MICHNGAFQPTKVKSYFDLYVFSVLPNTGMGVPNAEVQGDDLKHCLHLNQDVEEGKGP